MFVAPLIQSYRVCTVPRRSHHPSHQSCISTSATFRQPTPAHRTALSTQHIRPSGFSGCWSDGLELTVRWTHRSGVWCWQLQTVLREWLTHRSLI